MVSHDSDNYTIWGARKMADVWSMVATERESLADALAGLSPQDWYQDSLLPGWSVRDVTGHIIATAQMTPLKFILRMAASGFRFQSMSNKRIQATVDGKTTDQLVERLRELKDATNSPPGPKMTWLGETIVHGEDIFRALGSYRAHPVDHVIAVADFYKGSEPLIHAKSRVKGLTLRATDADWVSGSGPEVAGPAIALLMAMAGRKAALDDVSGDGVAILRER